MALTAYDVIIVSDFSYTGGNSSSIAEEVKAQSRAGLRTALVQAPSRRLKKPRALNSRITVLLEKGMAQLVPPTQQRIEAPVVLFRHPVPAEASSAIPIQIEASIAVLIVNQALFAFDGTAYDVNVASAMQAIEECTGLRPFVAPIGPLIRDQLAPRWSDSLIENDWVNVIDPEEWIISRGSVRNPPIVGRHSRPDWRKWPSEAADIRSAWPVTGDWRVKVLGGAQPAIDVIGGVPETWDVESYHADGISDFLAEIDFYIYFHHPSWMEAFCRGTLEAMAAGCISITHSCYAPLFEDGCVYCRPDDVPSVVSEFLEDPRRVDRQRELAGTIVENRFSHSAHVERLNKLFESDTQHKAQLPLDGMNGYGTRERAVPLETSQDLATGARRPLFVSSNGAGVGHLTRLVAIARKMPTSVRPVFLTLSEAIWLPERWGFAVERMPPGKQLGVSSRIWNHWFKEKVVRTIEAYGCDEILFDGTVPYHGLLSAAVEAEVPWFWLRRAMWKSGAPTRNLGRGEQSAGVIEPGEFASRFDRGPTNAYRSQVVKKAAPIIALDQEELKTRDVVREELGIGDEQTAVLITLGAGNVNVGPDPLEMAIDTVRSFDGIRVFATNSPIISRKTRLSLPENVASIDYYPLAELLCGFDIGIAASGYNTFHEMLAAMLPTVFIPTLETEVDDQLSRARFAQSSGLGRCVCPFDTKELEAAFGSMLRPSVRDGMARRLRELPQANGAAEVAAWLVAQGTGA